MLSRNASPEAELMETNLGKALRSLFFMSQRFSRSGTNGNLGKAEG